MYPRVQLYTSFLFTVTMASMVVWSDPVFAYRPFDSTDVAVIDVGELEIEFGPAGFRRSDTEMTFDTRRQLS